MKKHLIFSAVFLLLTATLQAQQSGVVPQGEKVSQETAQALEQLPGESSIPLEKYDTTAIVQIPVMSPSESKPAGNFDSNSQMPEGSSSGDQTPQTLAPVQDPQAAALQTPVDNALGISEAQEALEQAQEQSNTITQNATPAKLWEEGHFGLKLDGANQEENDIPPGTLAVYIDIEEAFNNNPWTIKARRNIKIDLETKQLEYVQMQSQLQELKNKLADLRQELLYYTPYYQNIQYIPALGDKTYPSVKADKIEEICKNLLFCSSATQVDSPLNIPLKIKQLKSAIEDTKKAIIEKEAFLLNYRELSKEEILSRQDYIVQQILKQIYSGIKEYATVRNIGIVVDKKDLIFGKPLDITPEFIKWMKSYNKKYTKENGDLL